MRQSTAHKNRGLALLLVLSILIIAVTSIAIAGLSLNASIQKRHALTLKSLTETRDAIMAWTQAQPFSLTNPPGTLPCPDTDLDGFSNKPTLNCSGELGFVPYRTLGIPEPRDGDGALLWYAVSNTYARDVNVTLNQFRNSSLLSPLFINTAANPMAFVLISQGNAINNQNRGNVSVANRAQFLEGVNSDNNFNDYSDVLDQTQNDQLLGLSVNTFWSEIEERVFIDMRLLLLQYMTTCSSYPWAVPFSATNNNGQPNTYQGRLPITNEWGQPCHAPQSAITAPPFQPQWLRDHWGTIFYYALCADTAPVNPPATSCLNLGAGTSARVVLIGPGGPLSGQNRAILTPVNYLENENASPVDNTFQKITRTNHTASFNDLIKVIAP